MNFATIKYYDIANGPGVRTSVFVSGCRHHCPGCFNEVAWNFGYGKPFDKATRNEVFASCQPDYIAGHLPAGRRAHGAGEPAGAASLCPQLQGPLPQKDGLVLLRLHLGAADRGRVPCHARCEVTDELLGLLDVLVDGRFVQAEHDISLRFRGSRNQRLLDVPKSLAAGAACLVAGRAGLFHPYDVALSVNAPHCQLLLPLSLTRHLPPAGGSLSKGEPLASFKSTAKLQCKAAL